MSNLQFYFALGVPFFTVVLMFIVSTISNRAAVSDLGKRIDDLGAGLNKRIDDLGAGLNKRIDDLRGDMNGQFTETHDKLDKVEKRLERVEDAVRVNHEARLASLEAHVFSKAS